MINIPSLLRERLGIEPQILNALPEHAAREGDVVASAGHLNTAADGTVTGVVTVATPMAGRGTDIQVARDAICTDCVVPDEAGLRGLGVEQQSAFPAGTVKCCVFCDEYDEATSCDHCFKPRRASAYPNKGRTQCRRNVPCGLHVIGFGHTSRRADIQLRARSARQGEPGSTRFLVSMQDALVPCAHPAGACHSPALDPRTRPSCPPDPVTEGPDITKRIARLQAETEDRESHIRIACARERRV